MRRLLSAVAVAAWALAAAIPAYAQKPVVGEWMVPKVKAREYPIKRLVVMPSQFTLAKDTMKGRQSLENENMRYGPIFDKALLAALRNSGVAVTEGTLSPGGDSENAGLRASAGTLQQGFDSVSTLMFQKPKEVKKGRFRVDEQVLSAMSLRDVAKNDAILFVRGKGGRQTKAKAFAAGGGLLGAAMAGGLHINVIMSFVDAITGEVLLLKGGMLKVHEEDTEKRMIKDLTEWLKDYRVKVFDVDRNPHGLS